MTKELMFFKIIPRHAIWGGTKITDYFGYPAPDKTGQIWAFSAQKDGTTICQNGEFKGVGLKEIWDTHPELFASDSKDFPYIISLVAPVDNLSVQVHPTDKVAQTLGFPHGKHEAWVMLESDPGSSLVYGSTLQIPGLVHHIKDKDFTGIFNTLPTHKGEFFFIPSGTIHGLGKGNIAYEIQQSTDLTFRIYDYDRREANGQPRELNVTEAVASLEDANPEQNTTTNYVHPAPSNLVKNENVQVHEYISNDAFTITQIKVNGKATLPKTGYWLTTVSEGTGTINGQEIKFADNFIVPATADTVELNGNFTLMITSENHTVPVMK